MKLLNNLYKICSAALLSLIVFGCQQPEEMVKPYALLADPSLTFAGQDAEPQTLTVASDEEWMIDVPEDWLTVTPITGNGPAEVTVTVEDNVDEAGKLAAPRECVITISLARSKGEYSVTSTIYQKGDTYLGVAEYTVSETAALEDKAKAKIKGGQVVALTADGFVLSDGTTNLFVKSDKTVAIGDQVYANGEKATANGLPVLVGDEVDVLSTSEVEYPTAKDITADIDTYESKSSEYISISGTLVGSAIKNIEGATKDAAVYKAHEAVELSKVNVRKVTLTGYYAGISGGVPQIIVTSYKDNGEDDTIGVEFPFRDDFSWLGPYIDVANQNLAEANQISDCVGEVTSSSDGCANIYTTLKALKLIEEIRAKGYTDLNPGQQTIYLQDQYLKFGKGNCQSGLILPLMKMDGSQDIIVAFRWCSQIGSSGAVDKTELIVEIDGPGTVVTAAGTSDAKVSDPVKSAQKSGEMFWQDAEFKINGATKATFITIRPTKFGSVDAPESGYYRYYLDDIQVFSSADAVTANINVTGLENDLITFEGTPGDPVSFDVTSDRAFTITPSAKWFTIDETEGGAGQIKTVTVTCEPSELSTSRKGTVIIKSGTSTRTINIVQSAAGQTLAPFMSIVGGNSGDVNFEAGSFTIDVQSNVEYEFSSDASWVTVEAAPATRALVETNTILVNYAANDVAEPRVAHIRVFNSEENIETVYTLTQAAFESGIYFQDDFTWIAPWADAGSASDSVAENDPNGTALNIYTHASCKADAVSSGISFVDEFANRGYVDLNPDSEVIYTQKYYLKFGKTSHNTGIKLPAIDFGATPVDAVVKFNWACHRRVKNKVAETDPVNIVVEILDAAGQSVFVSKELVTTQPVDKMEWQDASVLISNVTSDMRIVIRPSDMSPASGVVNRWYVDNIKVVKPEPVFSETFDWIAPWADAGSASDSVAENDPNGTALNIYTHASCKADAVSSGISFVDEFANRGYVDLNPDSEVIYTQKYYLKFGKTSHNTGIKLPAIDFGTTPRDAVVKFNWACHRRVKNKVAETDPVNIVVEVLDAAGKSVFVSEEFVTTQPVDVMEWQDASITLENITSANRIVIRPSNMAPASGVVNRWYIDNIVIY